MRWILKKPFLLQAIPYPSSINCLWSIYFPVYKQGFFQHCRNNSLNIRIHCICNPRDSRHNWMSGIIKVEGRTSLMLLLDTTLCFSSKAHVLQPTTLSYLPNWFRWENLFFFFWLGRWLFWLQTIRMTLWAADPWVFINTIEVAVNWLWILGTF